MPRRAVTLLVLAVLASSVAASPPAHAAPAPLDKQNWVVSVAGYRTDAYRNYVRLGYLVFSRTANTVEHNFWAWNQADRPLPVNSGDVYYCGSYPAGTNPRNNCPVHTGRGFTGDPNGHFTGTYAYDATAGTVTVEYTSSTVDGSTIAVDLTETWKVSAPKTGLGRIELTGSSYSANKGVGYGSNAGFESAGKATMAQIRTHTEPFLLEGWAWNNSKVATFTKGGSGGLTMSGYNLCDDGSCLGTVQYNAGCAATSCCKAGDQACIDRLNSSGNRRFYYMTGDYGGRRNSYEYWCECLSYEGCYQLNSHVKPLLQVLDDGGGFQGWVGVETSADRTDPWQPAGEYGGNFALIS